MLIVLGGVAINVIVVATMYRFLTSRAVTWDMVWPGAVFTGLVAAGVEILGWEPVVPLREGLTRTITYFRERRS